VSALPARSHRRRLDLPARAALAATIAAALSSSPACAPKDSPLPAVGPAASSRAEPAETITQTPGFVRELRRLDVTLDDGAHASLDALVTRPAVPGRVPLVVINHGSPREAAQRTEMSPTNQSAQAMVFARRGYGVAIVMRRGFGATGGSFAETPGACFSRDYERANRNAAADVTGAVRALASEPWVDSERIVLVGHSAGGASALATAAANPRGVVAVVSFAGGRGSDAPNHVCQADRLVEAFRAMGQGTQVPSLWIYAENDHFFAPPLVRELFDAYRAKRAPAELVVTPPFGVDGHRLFSGGPAELWWPIVAPFLAARHLPIDVVWPRVPMPVDAPPELPEAGQRAFVDYLASEGVEKAFAVGGPAWGWAGGQRTRAEAVQKAIEHCASHAKSPCRAWAIGDLRAP
jgi:dienelactone hydrolase